MEETKKTGIGSIIGTIIIIALIVLGGLYFWGKRLEESKTIQTMTTEETTGETQPLSAEEQELNSIKNTSPSDELSAIETDLNATKLDNLEADVEVSVQ